MKLRINGVDREVAPVSTLAQLLEELGIDAGKSGFAVARNAEVISKSSLAKTPVEDGDRIEIVQAVQGG